MEDLGDKADNINEELSKIDLTLDDLREYFESNRDEEVLQELIDKSGDENLEELFDEISSFAHSATESGTRDEAYDDIWKKLEREFHNLDFDGDDVSITIPLDEKYDGKQNAQRYYNKYQKFKKGQVHILNQLRINQDEQDYFNALTQQLALASVHDAIEIKEELIRGAYIRTKLPKRSSKQIKIHYLQLLLDNDIRIYVGKNNLQNETITFKIGQKKDLWFHAKDYHGAHVLLQGDKISKHKRLHITRKKNHLILL